MQPLQLTTFRPAPKSYPTMVEVSELLAQIAPSGESLDLKTAAVRQLYPDAFNIQGIHVADDLTMYSEY